MSPRFCRALLGLALVVVLLTSIGCDAVVPSSKEEPTPTPIPPPPVPAKPTYVVKVGLVEDLLSFTGRVSPSVEEELFFRVGGRVDKVYVQRNDMIEKGTLLAELDNSDLLRQLAQAEIELETAELNLQEANAAKEFSIARAQLNLDIKVLQLQKLEQQQQLSNPDLAIAAANLQKADASRKAAQAAYDARARQPGVEASPQALNLEQATINYDIALATYNKAMQDSELSGRERQLDLEIMRKQIALAELDLKQLQEDVDVSLVNAVERAKLTVERLQAQIDATRIISPIDGKVTSVSAYEGRTIDAFQPIFVVADETELEITADPTSSDLQKMKEGMPVTVIFSSYPGQEFSGEIAQLPYPYGTGGGSTQVEEQDKLTHITFTANNVTVKPGDLVKVMVVLEQKDDALWLPPAAIRTFAGRQFVEIEEGGRSRRVDVTIGIESADRIEILDGLEEGQVVIGQ
jgi:RND family efflux transporter MFP subunit